MQVIRVISGENELSALEAMKHYDLRVVHLIDPNREFERRYSRDGWPFLLLADGSGRVLFKANNLVEGVQAELEPVLESVLTTFPTLSAVLRNDIPYMPATLARSSETQKAKVIDRFPALACGPGGKVYLAFTRDEECYDAWGSDVVLRFFDGEKWSDDRPIVATEADESDPSLVVDRKGTVWLSWLCNAPDDYNIHVAPLNERLICATTAKVTNADNHAMRGRLAASDDGSVYLSYYKWHRMGPKSRDKEVYVRRWDGAKWSDETHVSPEDVPTYEDHSDPAIAARGDTAVVVWSWDFHKPKGYTTQASDPTIFFREARAGGLGERAIDLSGRDIDVSPAVAIDGANRLVAAWDSLGYDRKSGRTHKNLTTRSFHLTDREASPYARKLRTGLVNVCTPCFATAPGGDLTLVWSETGNGSDWSVCRMDYEARTQRWSDPEVVSSEGRPRYPAAAYDAEGNLWVAFSVEKEGGRRIEVREVKKATNRTNRHE